MPRKRLFVPLTILLAVLLACDTTGLTPTPDTNDIATFIAQTMTAAAAKTLPATFTASATSTPTQTFTPRPPTASATITLTSPPILTPTIMVPLISVSVATNCRNGPGKVYGLEGALLVGETAEVLAKDPTSNYWYIRNPDPGDEFCWVWGNYATLTGNISALPVFTPPPTPTRTLTPTPTPNFEAVFLELDDCAGSWWVDITLKNTGGFAFRSMGLTVKDKDTDVVVTSLTDGFTDRTGCLSTTSKDVIEPGKSFVVSSSGFAYDLNGHNLRATITLCTSTGQGGTCVTKIINFKP